MGWARGLVGAVGPRDTHSCAFCPELGTQSGGGAGGAVDGEELLVRPERRGAGDRRELTLGLYPSHMRLQVSDPLVLMWVGPKPGSLPLQGL